MTQIGLTSFTLKLHNIDSDNTRNIFIEKSQISERIKFQNLQRNYWEKQCELKNQRKLDLIFLNEPAELIQILFSKEQ